MKIILFAVVLLSSFVAWGDSLLAVNVALSVPEKLQDRVKVINNELKEANSSSFLFDSTHIPHLTILQFYIEERNLNSFLTGIEVEKLKALKLKTKDFVTSDLEKDSSMKFLNLSFQKTEVLSQFQRMVIARSSLFRVRSGTREAFYEPLSIDQQFVKYVSNFVDEEAGEKFSPHITLGLVNKWDRDNSSIKPNEEFLFDEIIISQIGNYGTARKILKKIKLMEISKK